MNTLDTIKEEIAYATKRRDDAQRAIKNLEANYPNDAWLPIHKNTVANEEYFLYRLNRIIDRTNGDI